MLICNFCKFTENVINVLAYFFNHQSIYYNNICAKCEEEKRKDLGDLIKVRYES